jgi:hypothetical protein
VVDECALYQPPALNAATLVDFALWGGKSESAAVRAAVETGLGTGGGRYLVDPPTGSVGFAAGCSLGRVRFTRSMRDAATGKFRQTRDPDWDVYPPTHFSPGKPNLWGPPSCMGNSVLTSARGIAFFWGLPDGLMHGPTDLCIIRCARLGTATQRV